MDSEDIVRKFHQKRGRIRDSRSGIRDPEKIYPGSGSRFQGVKKHRIPDPDTGFDTGFENNLSHL
jgi:hypothetical protein